MVTTSYIVRYCPQTNLAWQFLHQPYTHDSLGQRQRYEIPFAGDLRVTQRARTAKKTVVRCCRHPKGVLIDTPYHTSYCVPKTAARQKCGLLSIQYGGRRGRDKPNSACRQRNCDGKKISLLLTILVCEEFEFRNQVFCSDSWPKQVWQFNKMQKSTKECKFSSVELYSCNKVFYFCYDGLLTWNLRDLFRGNLSDPHFSAPSPTRPLSCEGDSSVVFCDAYKLLFFLSKLSTEKHQRRVLTALRKAWRIFTPHVISFICFSWVKNVHNWILKTLLVFSLSLISLLSLPWSLVGCYLY